MPKWWMDGAHTYCSPPCNERERPKHSPVKAHNNPGDEGKSPAPQRQNTIVCFFQIMEGVAYRAETNPRPTRFRMPVSTEANVKNQAIFSPIAKGFYFCPKRNDKGSENVPKLAGEEPRSKTYPSQSYICSAKFACRDYGSLEASWKNENLEILLQNMTPNSRSSATISQELLSQHSRNWEALSQQLLSQSSHLCPSRHIHLERLRFDTPSQGPTTPARRSKSISQQSYRTTARQKFKEAMVQAEGTRSCKR